MKEKATAWVQGGARVELVVDPQIRTIRRHAADRDIDLVRIEMPDLDAVILGFKLDVNELFA